MIRSAIAGLVVLAAMPANAGTLSPDDVEALGRVVYAEAAGEPAAGKAGVLAVILNRAGEGSVQAVVDQPGQFEPVLRAPGKTWRSLPALTADQQTEYRFLLDLARSGHLPDVTGGAVYFQNPVIVAKRAAAGQVRASLVDFGGKARTTAIGNHAFYGGTWRSTKRQAEQNPGPTVFLSAPAESDAPTQFGVATTR